MPDALSDRELAQPQPEPQDGPSLTRPDAPLGGTEAVQAVCSDPHAWERLLERGSLPLASDDAAKELVRAHAESKLPPGSLDVAVLCRFAVLGSVRWLIAGSFKEGVMYDVTYDYSTMQYYLDEYRLADRKAVSAERRYA